MGQHSFDGVADQGARCHRVLGVDDQHGRLVEGGGQQVGERMDRSAAGLAGLAALRVVMLEALPLDPQRLLEAEIEVSFWGRSLGSPELAALQTGQKEVRYAHLLSGEVRITEPEVEPDRIGKLEKEIEDLKKQFEQFRKQFE